MHYPAEVFTAMTAQARSQNLDTDNLVLLVDHLVEFADLSAPLCALGAASAIAGITAAFISVAAY